MVPDDVRESLREKLWDQADSVGWSDLPMSAKTRHYEDWSRDPKIGGLLARFMDAEQVRVYLKNSLLKDYSNARIADQARPFRALGVAPPCDIAEVYVKPHGRRLNDGRVICWGRAEDWKTILMALHERCFATPNTRPHGVVLLRSIRRFSTAESRRVVCEAAAKLGIEKLIWLDL